MTTKEFSDGFTTLLNSYALAAGFGSQASDITLSLDEYEKSLFLTNAQKEIVKSYYSGNNSIGISFERTEEIRRYLDFLVKTCTPESIDGNGTAVSDMSYMYTLPDDLAYITLERATFSESDECWGGRRVGVVPVTHDYLDRILDNPFRGASEHRVLRLDTGDNTVELISRHPIAKYLIKYVANPEPIVLVDLPDGLSIDGVSTEQTCKLHEMLHEQILELAVRTAIEHKRLYTRADT